MSEILVSTPFWHVLVLSICFYRAGVPVFDRNWMYDLLSWTEIRPTNNISYPDWLKHSCHRPDLLMNLWHIWSWFSELILANRCTLALWEKKIEPLYRKIINSEILRICFKVLNQNLVKKKPRKICWKRI